MNECRLRPRLRAPGYDTLGRYFFLFSGEGHAAGLSALFFSTLRSVQGCAASLRTRAGVGAAGNKRLTAYKTIAIDELRKSRLQFLY
jgi:hypothetical protein